MPEDWHADWDEAHKAIKSAERLLHKGECEQARSEAGRAVHLGIRVMHQLFTTEEIVRETGLWDHIEDGFRHAISAQDYVNGAKKVLLRFINMSHPENKLWGEDDLK